MEILDKKLKQVSRAKAWVFEHSEFHVLQRNVNFLSLRNLLSNELFFTFYIIISILFYPKLSTK